MKIKQFHCNIRILLWC